MGFCVAADPDCGAGFDPAAGGLLRSLPQRSSCARNTRSNSFSFLNLVRTLMYAGGGGIILGLKLTLSAYSCASIPSSRVSPASEPLSLAPLSRAPFFLLLLLPMNRLRNDTPFL